MKRLAQGHQTAWSVFLQGMDWTLCPLRAEMYCLVPRGSQRQQPIQKTWPKKKIIPGFTASQGPHWVPTPSQQTAAGLPPQPGWVLLLGSNLSSKEGSLWNVTGGYRGLWVTPLPLLARVLDTIYHLRHQVFCSWLAEGWWSTHP